MNQKPRDRDSAMILPFPRRRGRPKSRRMDNDTGTPELVMKRARGETVEALDLCLARGIITPQQHWCGIHLRWLYTLRHGAPGVRAVDPTHLGGIETKLDDPEWRASREKEYHEAIARLGNTGYAAILMNLCIYNERPVFLGRITASTADKANTMLAKVRDALDVLAEHWERVEAQKV